VEGKEKMSGSRLLVGVCREPQRPSTTRKFYRHCKVELKIVFHQWRTLMVVFQMPIAKTEKITKFGAGLCSKENGWN
jgi:hypothetical protein